MNIHTITIALSPLTVITLFTLLACAATLIWLAIHWKRRAHTLMYEHEQIEAKSGEDYAEVLRPNGEAEIYTENSSRDAIQNLAEAVIKMQETAGFCKKWAAILLALTVLCFLFRLVVVLIVY